MAVLFRSCCSHQFGETSSPAADSNESGRTVSHICYSNMTGSQRAVDILGSRHVFGRRGPYLDRLDRQSAGAWATCVRAGADARARHQPKKKQSWPGLLVIAFCSASHRHRPKWRPCVKTLKAKVSTHIGRCKTHPESCDPSRNPLEIDAAAQAQAGAADTGPGPNGRNRQHSKSQRRPPLKPHQQRAIQPLGSLSNAHKTPQGHRGQVPFATPAPAVAAPCSTGTHGATSQYLHAFLRSPLKPLPSATLNAITSNDSTAKTNASLYPPPHPLPLVDPVDLFIQRRFVFKTGYHHATPKQLLAVHRDYVAVRESRNGLSLTP